MALLLRYRKIIWLIVSLLLLVGVLTYIQLPKRDIPEIEQEIANISVVYPGANPEIVERNVTNPIEEALSSIDGIEEVSSTSTTGFANITVMVEDGLSNTEMVYNSIQQTVSEESEQFSSDVRSINVNTDLIQSNVATYHFLADSIDELLDNRDHFDEIETQISEISGVEGIQIKGLPEQTLAVNIDPDALNENQLQPNVVIERLNEALSPIAIGTEVRDETIYQLSLSDASSIDDLEQMIIGQAQDDEPIRLVDVASIELDHEPSSDLIDYEGQAAISLTIQADTGTNIVALQESIDETVTPLFDELPESISVDQYFTQSTVIDEVYSNLIQSLIISLIAVFIVMLLGLTTSSAILVAIAIPLSIIFGLIPLPFFGVDLNQISVIGIIVAIGILVDDAIVVNDNIQRQFEKGMDAFEGTRKGVKEVSVSIVTSTLLIVFSFVPLTFLSGSNGDFIRGLPLALVFTVLASTFIALTFIPVIRYSQKRRMKKTRKQRAGWLNGILNKIADIYAESIIPFTLKKPVMTSIVGVIVSLALLSLALFVPFEFFPSADREEVTISVRLDEGTPIEQTQSEILDIEAFIQDEADHINETVTYTGDGLPNIFNSQMSRTGENTGQIVVRVDRDSYSATEFIDDWENEIRDAYSDAEVFLTTIVSGPPEGAEVEVSVQGPDLEELSRLADSLESDLDALDSSSVVIMNTDLSQPVIDYEIDDELLESEGIDREQVTSLMQLANVGAPLGTFDDGVDRFDLEVRYDDGDEDRLNLEELEVIGFPDGQGQMPSILSLDDLISAEESTQIASIPHIDGDRAITLEAYQSDDDADLAGDAEAVIDQFESELPSDYSLITTGSADAESEFFLEVGTLFLVVLFLIYMTLVVQFNSLTTPLLITATILLAVAGAFIGLFVSGEPLSFLAVLGIVALSGVVVRNSILLIEFIEQNKAIYDTQLEAFQEAGRARLRPIILTTLTSMAALIPIIITGDVLFRPLAVSIVYGILFATALTLWLLPAFYFILLKIRKSK
ncbi:Multidrug efflux pump subunit AcrB [Pelagirhabdus alkalitolerans]|uniref:Multidrug efflux pump subunit AcrB n=1 Tax=Pelagirhabdus alkalitolerans TaxID=1612202 RepID=A0A1G6GIF2_9BACI|nr:efflux RND transporter permease subunit [Pelagirhabdus alkalitolerans]SDB81724.1 Multidrug efflux pump subunit AcrB [Pelagirhabdus alkalitolerans]